MKSTKMRLSLKIARKLLLKTIFENLYSKKDLKSYEKDKSLIFHLSQYNSAIIIKFLVPFKRESKCFYSVY